MSKITITVEAETVVEMAAKLSALSTQFGAINKIMAEPMPPGEKPALADAPTPIEQAIAAAPPQEAAAPPKPAGKPRKGEKPPKDVKPPTDRIFPDEAAPLAEASDAPDAYTADLSDEDAYQLLRTRAKLHHDKNGPDPLTATWMSIWPQIRAEHGVENELPAVKYLEGNRPAILLALAAMDTAMGLDPVTGEQTGDAADPAADMF